MSNNNNNIIIIGSGISGLSIAVLLQKYYSNSDITIYERDPYFKYKNQGYSLTIQKNSYPALKKLGIYDHVLNTPIRITKHTYYDENNKQLAAFGKIKSEYKKHDYKRKNIPIPRLELRKLLYNQLKDKNIKFNKSVEGYEINKISGIIKVIFRDGTSDNGNLVIACDGINSKIRKLMLNVKPNFLGIMMINGLCDNNANNICANNINVNNTSVNDINANNTNANIEQVYQFIDNRNRFFIKPFDKNMMMWQLTFPLIEDSCRLLSLSVRDMKKEALDRARKFKSDHINLVTMIEHTKDDMIRGNGLYDININNPNKFLNRDDNLCKITFIGDSIHAMSPFKGQGANNALIDSLSLLNSLLKYKNKDNKDNKDIIEAIKDYEKEMFNRTKKYVDSSRNMVNFFHNNTTSKNITEKFNKFNKIN